MTSEAVIVETFRCNLCNYTTNVANDLNTHVHSHMKYTCQKGCNKTSFVTQSQLDSHIEDHHRKVKPIQIKCDICSAKFVAQHQLSQHVSKKHTRNSQNQQLLHCQKCGQILNLKMN